MEKNRNIFKTLIILAYRNDSLYCSKDLINRTFRNTIEPNVLLSESWKTFFFNNEFLFLSFELSILAIVHIFFTSGFKISFFIVPVFK